MECCRCTHTECPGWERINLITDSFLAAVISAIRLDKGLAQRLACSELIVQRRAPKLLQRYRNKTDIHGQDREGAWLSDIGHSEVSPAIGLRRPLSRAPQGDGPYLTA